LWTAGYGAVAGMDEAGRGALAGPVAVAAVVLPNIPRLIHLLDGVRDSKQLTGLQRNRLAPLIQGRALAWGLGACSAEEIDQLGIVAATRLAAARSLVSAAILPDYLLTDFRLELPELDVPQTALVKGDRLSLSIAAASILAKTWRDARMCELDHQFSQYGFSGHKGYGTLRHRQAILRSGPTPVHRRSFSLTK
jgi:ribonuclease HII